MFTPKRTSWPAEPNKEIFLAEKENTHLTINSKKLTHTSRLSLELLPIPRAVFQGIFSISDLKPSDITSEGKIRISIGKSSFDAYITQAKFGPSKGQITTTFSPQKEATYVGSKKPVQQISAVLLNLPSIATKIIGPPNEEGIIAYRSGATFEADGWKIELIPIVDLGKLLQELERGGGYGVTHHILISRSDGSTIDFTSGREFLDTLELFFTFVRGIRCSPTLQTGLTGEDVLWTDFGAPRTERWSMVYNWYTQHGEPLQELFPGFLARCKSSWKKELRTIIKTYAQANRYEPSIEGSILLGQAALESLAWAVLVEHDDALDEHGLKILTASNQISLLLHELKILKSIPSTYSGLQKFASASKSNGPNVITEVRNSIIHADTRRSKSLTPQVLCETWGLVMQYVELCLLRIFNYNGLYYNRSKGPLMNEKSVETVPWNP